MTDDPDMHSQKEPADTGDDDAGDRPDASRPAPKSGEAAKRIEKGEPKPDDVNPLAPPVNIQGGA